jgi:hypothetical protein
MSSPRLRILLIESLRAAAVALTFVGQTLQAMMEEVGRAKVRIRSSGPKLLPKCLPDQWLVLMTDGNGRCMAMDILEQSCHTKMGKEGWDSVIAVIPRAAKNVKEPPGKPSRQDQREEESPDPE